MLIRHTIPRTRLGFVGVSVAVALFACDTRSAMMPDGVIASDELVTLSLGGVSGDRRLTLTPKPGVKINALLAPVIETADSASIVFDAKMRTADSAYFTEPPTAAIGDRHTIKGRLLASACPEGKRVCRSVMFDIDWH